MLNIIGTFWEKIDLQNNTWWSASVLSICGTFWDTVDHQPKNRGKFSILWARVGKKNRLSLEHLLHLLGSKSKIRITLIIGQKSGENSSNYSCVLKKNRVVLCSCGTFWDQNHTWLSNKKVDESKSHFYYWGQKWLEMLDIILP